MSDAFGGPGWWFASDGKWYPPEEHPNADYRAQHNTSPSEPVIDLDAPPAADEPSLVPPTQTHDGPVENGPSAQDTIDLRDFPLPAAGAQESPRTFTVASRSFADAPTRPSFSPKRAPSVVDPNRDSSMPPPGSSLGRLRVEVASAARASIESSTMLDRPTPVKLSTSTELVPVSVPAVGLATFHDRVVALTMFLAGVAMIVGTFLDWTVGSLTETGWHRGDGVVMLLAGVLGASMAGPITVGVRHVLPKSIAIMAGLVGIATAGLAAMTSVLDGSSEGVGFGVGFFVVFGGAVAMLIAGLADAGEALE